MMHQSSRNWHVSVSEERTKREWVTVYTGWAVVVRLQICDHLIIEHCV